MYIFDIFTNLFRKQKCVRYLRNLYRENNRYKIYISRTNTGYRFILKFNNSESFWNFIDQKYIFAYLFAHYIYYIKCIVFLANPGQHKETRRTDKNIFVSFDLRLSRVLSRVSRIGRRRAREANRGGPENFTVVFFSRPWSPLWCRKKKEDAAAERHFSALLRANLRKRQNVEAGGREENVGGPDRTQQGRGWVVVACMFLRPLHAAIIRKVHLTRNERNRTSRPALLYHSTAFYEG